LNKKTFIDKRYKLYQEKKWDEYEELLQWETSLKDTAFGESLDAVSKAISVEKSTIIYSAS